MPLISLEDYRKLFDFPVIEYYRRIGFDLEEHPFETLSNEFISEYIQSRKDLPLQPGALEALTFFRERNIPQCVLSATQSDALRKTLDEVNRRLGVEVDFHVDLRLAHDEFYIQAKKIS